MGWGTFCSYCHSIFSFYHSKLNRHTDFADNQLQQKKLSLQTPFFTDTIIAPSKVCNEEKFFAPNNNNARNWLTYFQFIRETSVILEFIFHNLKENQVSFGEVIPWSINRPVTLLEILADISGRSLLNIYLAYFWSFCNHMSYFTPITVLHPSKMAFKRLWYDFWWRRWLLMLLKI